MAERTEALIESHDSLCLEVAILLDFTEDHIGSEALNSIVELILPKLRGLVAHPIVWPIRISLSMECSEVLNHLQSLLEDCSVQKGVQSVSAHGQSVDLSWNYTTVLLRSQVFYTLKNGYNHELIECCIACLGKLTIELSSGKLLVTSLMLVFTCDELVSQVFNVSSTSTLFSKISKFS